MDRKDIIINIDTHAFVISKGNTPVFNAVKNNNIESGMSDKYMYWDIAVTRNAMNSQFIIVKFPYIADSKYCMVRLMIGGIPVLAPNNSEWITMFDENGDHIMSQGIYSINIDGEIALVNINNSCIAYSGNVADFTVLDSLQQDANIIVQSNPTDIFQHPLVGVGIGSYLNAPDSSYELNKKILEELTRDGIFANTVNLSGNNVAMSLNKENSTLGYEEQ